MMNFQKLNFQNRVRTFFGYTLYTDAENGNISQMGGGEEECYPPFRDVFFLRIKLFQIFRDYLISRNHQNYLKWRNFGAKWQKSPNFNFFSGCAKLNPR